MNQTQLTLLPVLFFLLLSCGGNSDSQKTSSLTPSELLLEIADSRRLISADEVADKMINEDPSLQLVDVRSTKDFTTFSLPGAINIPLENTLSETASQQLDCEKYTYVFYSNDDIHAEQAWMLNRRKGCKGSYILKGGLNAWVETIMRPLPPPATASSEELDRYQFRLAASRYFAGGSRAMKPEPFVQPAPKPSPQKVTQPAPKKVKKDDDEGGC